MVIVLLALVDHTVLEMVRQLSVVFALQGFIAHSVHLHLSQQMALWVMFVRKENIVRKIQRKDKIARKVGIV